MIQGRLFNPDRVDEVVVTPQFAATFGKGVGCHADPAPGQPSADQPGIRRVHRAATRAQDRARVVGIGRSPLGSVNVEGPGRKGGVLASPALFRHYRANILGTNGQAYINAWVRLKGGAAAIPAFRADLARVTGRSGHRRVGQP